MKTLTKEEIIEAFKRLKSHDITQLQELYDINTEESILISYFLIKSFKLANDDAFVDSNHHRINAICKRVVGRYYPPLEICHKLEDGFDGLEAYYEIAQTVFND